MAIQKFVFELLACASFVGAVPLGIHPTDDCQGKAENDKCAIIDTEENTILDGTCKAAFVS